MLKDLDPATITAAVPVADVTPADADREVQEYLARQNSKDLLRFITCGSVDDGKSTLIGRLLYDCKCLFEDQLASLETDSGRFGTTGAGQLDLARDALEKFVYLRPSMSAASIRDGLRFMEPALLDRYVGGLETAGLA